MHDYALVQCQSKGLAVQLVRQGEDAGREDGGVNFGRRGPEGAEVVVNGRAGNRQEAGEHQIWTSAAGPAAVRRRQSAWHAPP